MPSRFPCCVLLALSWNTTNENPSTDIVEQQLPGALSGLAALLSVFLPSRFPCCVLLALSWNKKNENPVHSLLKTTVARCSVWSSSSVECVLEALMSAERSMALELEI